MEAVTIPYGIRIPSKETLVHLPISKFYSASQKEPTTSTLALYFTSRVIGLEGCNQKVKK